MTLTGAHLRSLAIAVALTCTAAGNAVAQSYPSKTIRVVTSLIGTAKPRP